jgi:hypothetical protein
MNATEIVLTVSLLLNVAFLLGAPIVLFVRFLIRRVRWIIIGMGANGIEVRHGTPKGGYYLWKGHGKNGIVLIEGRLVGTATDGRQVLWVDTDNCHQIAPERLSTGDLARLPDDVKKKLVGGGQLGQLAHFRGAALNDSAMTSIQSLDGKTVNLPYLVWQRISGWRLFKAVRDTRVSQLNDPQAGLAALAEKLVPLGVLLALVLLIALLFMG